MAYVSKIRIPNGTTYDIQDASAVHGITDSYSGTSSTAALSQKGANALYNAVKGSSSSGSNTSVSNGTELVIFGDSWADPTVDAVTWPKIVSSKLGLNVHNYAKSVATITTAESGNNVTSVQMGQFNSDTSYDKSKVKYIIIFGGINDKFSHNVAATDLGKAIVSLGTSLKQSCKNAIIFWSHNSMWPYSFSEASYFRDVCTYVTETSNSVVIPIFNYGWMPVEYINPANWFHPTAEGSQLMGEFLLEHMGYGKMAYKPIHKSYSTKVGKIDLYYTWHDNFTVNLGISVTDIPNGSTGSGNQQFTSQGDYLPFSDSDAVRIRLPISGNNNITIAPATTLVAWSFDGTVSGPVSAYGTATLTKA